MERTDPLIAPLRSGLLACMLAMASCAYTDDPSQGGLLGGIYGLSSGRYEQHVQERQQALTQLQSANQGLTAESQRLDTARRMAAADRDRLQQQVAALNAETQRLNRTSQHLQTTTADQRQQKAELDRQLAALKSEIAQLNRRITENQISVQEAERQRQQLQQRSDDLEQLYQAML